MKKILILGVSGMLGSMVREWLGAKKDVYEVAGTMRGFADRENSFDFDAENDDIEKIISDFRPDYIINCIGIINQYCKDDDPAGVKRAIRVNALFPHVLAEKTGKPGIRVIQIATDCVFSGKAGKYRESSPHDALDVYGKTKSLGEVKSANFLNIRCSIIGPERKNKNSLLEWFLGQSDGAELKGFAHHIWNGVTTLQFARLCDRIITDDLFDSLSGKSHIHHYVPNETVSKYGLLNIFKEVFEKNCNIREVDDVGEPVDRSLTPEFNCLHEGELSNMKNSVIELKQYIDKVNYYEQSN